MRKLTLLSLLGIVLAAVPAWADTIMVDLSFPNTALSGFTGPYDQVTVDLVNSTTADISFDALTNGGFTYLLGDGSTADVNVNASSFTVSGITCSNPFTGFTCGPISQDKAGTVDGFGLFNLRLKSSDGFGNSSSDITFTLTNVSGTWSSAANVLALNANGSDLAAHGFACAVTCNQAEGAAATGFVANGVSSVPEPASLLLLGSGLLGIGTFARRRLGRGSV